MSPPCEDGGIDGNEPRRRDTAQATGELDASEAKGQEERNSDGWVKDRGSISRSTGVMTSGPPRQTRNTMHVLTGSVRLKTGLLGILWEDATAFPDFRQGEAARAACSDCGCAGSTGIIVVALVDWRQRKRTAVLDTDDMVGRDGRSECGQREKHNLWERHCG